MSRQRLGELDVEPALRRISHDDGREEIVEPRVMQVLVALIQADGQIVTRDQLHLRCWPGVVVGEDAINRVMGRLRRLSDGIGAGSLKVETITKVGYRLVSPPPVTAPVAAPAKPGEGPSLALPDRPSIAVLPFKNMSGDPDQEYFADAITEDVVTALSRWRWFFVIARHTSFRYKNLDVDLGRIGDELGVRYTLEGSVRKVGNHVRVTVRLVDAGAGATVLANQFDRELVDILALQDEITERVVAAIEPAMLHGEGVRSATKSPTDFSALDCFYRGMWHLNMLLEAGDAEALGFFREAIRRDPELPLGYIGLARVLYGRAVFGSTAESTATLREALAAAQTAIRLDGRDAYGYFAASGACLYLGDHDAALEGAERAIALNPNFAYGHYRLGQVLIFGGRPAEAIEPIEKGRRFSPYDPQLALTLETLALAHYQNRNYEEAVKQASAAAIVSDGSGAAILAASLARLGRAAEAAKAYARARRSIPPRRRTLAPPYRNPAHLEHLREGFRLAGQGRES